MKFKDKVKYAVSNLSPISEKLFFYGTVIPLVLLACSIVFYGIGTYTDRQIALIAIKTAFGIFAEFMLAGLIFDCVKKERER